MTHEQLCGLGRPRPGSRNNLSLLISHGIAMDDWTKVRCESLMPLFVCGLVYVAERPLFHSLASGMSPMNSNLSYP